MHEALITCPVCGETVPYARRCRKCAASFDNILEPPAPPNTWDGRAETRYELELIWGNNEHTHIPTRNPKLAQVEVNPRQHLEITDRANPKAKKVILLPKGIKMAPARWRVTHNADRAVFSAFFYLNGAGHDIDTWLHYDLETGELIEMNPGEENERGTHNA